MCVPHHGSTIVGKDILGIDIRNQNVIKISALATSILNALAHPYLDASLRGRVSARSISKRIGVSSGLWQGDTRPCWCHRRSFGLYENFRADLIINHVWLRS